MNDTPRRVETNARRIAREVLTRPLSQIADGYKTRPLAPLSENESIFEVAGRASATANNEKQLRMLVREDDLTLI